MFRDIFTKGGIHDRIYRETSPMTLVAYALAVIAVTLSLIALFRHTGRMGVRRFTGLNDSDTSKRYFLFLLAQAQTKMIVYDVEMMSRTPFIPITRS